MLEIARFVCYERTVKIREIGLNWEGRRREDTERDRQGKRGYITIRMHYKDIMCHTICDLKFYIYIL